MSQRSGLSQRSRNRLFRSSAASVDSRSVGSMSLSECLAAFKQHKQKQRRSTRRSGSTEEKDHGSSASIGDMPSLVSYGQDSYFSSIPSFNSSIESAFTISSTDLSLISETSVNTISTLATKNTIQEPQPPPILGPPDLESLDSDEEDQSQIKSIEETVKNPTKEEAPIQIMRIRKREHSQRGSQRPLLKSSAKEYTPDVIPLRESRWHTESAPIVQSGKAGRSRDEQTLTSTSHTGMTAESSHSGRSNNPRTRRETIFLR